MKQLLFTLSICSLLFTACSKKDNNNTNANTIGITDNGLDLVMTSTYLVANENIVNVTLIKTGSSSALVLSTSNSSSSRQFELHLKAYGSYAASGTFTQTGSNGDNQLAEFFTNGQNYIIDHSVVEVSNNNDTYLSGTFVLYLANSNGSKTVSGYFNAAKPEIQ